jgi:hypothetical protein
LGRRELEKGTKGVGKGEEQKRREMGRREEEEAAKGGTGHVGQVL